jgi:hypothetical protein
MNTTQTSGLRALTASELEQVTGGLKACAAGVHIKEATITVRATTTPSGSYFSGTDEAAGQKA